MIKTLYETSATATGGRDGRASTADGSFAVKLATPTALGGAGDGNNPEELFAAGYAACFLGAMKFASSRHKLAKVPLDASVTATVGIGPRQDEGFGLKVRLAVSLPGIEHNQAEALVKAGDKVCPYSHATRGNIEVTIELIES